MRHINLERHCSNRRLVTRKIAIVLFACLILISVTACRQDSSSKDGANASTEAESAETQEVEDKASLDVVDEAISESNSNEGELMQSDEQEAEETMIVTINGETISVAWEDNESVAALMDLVSEEALSIQMSMYGGFEQVGNLGTSLPRNDKQITTEAGDIFLYSGNQIVMFYDSHSWSYTRLGKVTGMTKSELEDLLGNGDVTITISTKG